MQKLVINLNLISDVQEFTKIVNTLECDADIVRGKYVIDAKSVIGIFTIDLSKPVDLILHTEDDNVAKLFNKWLVK